MRDGLRALRAVAARPDLRRLEAAHMLVNVGFWSASAPMAVFYFREGGATLLGVVLLVRTIPTAVAGPILSSVADSMPRRRVMAASAAAAAALTAVTATALDAGAPVAVIVGISVLSLIMSTPFEAARNAMLPSVAGSAEELAAANVVSSTIEGGSVFLGPALGGLLLALVGIHGAVWAAPVLIGAGAVTALRMQTPGEVSRSEGDEGEGEHEGVLAGFRALAQEPDSRVVAALFALQVVLDGVLGVLITVAALDLLDMSNSGVGVLNATLGVGALVGSAIALGMNADRLGERMATGLVVWGLPLVAIGAFAEPAVALIALAVLGIGNTLIDTAGFTLLQRATPDEVRGRVFGALESILWGSVAVGGAIAPLLISVLGIRGALVAAGAVLPVSAAASLARLRQIDARAVVPRRALDLLRAQPILGALPLPELEALAEAARFDRFGAGDVILRQGEPGDAWYVVADGEVEVEVDGQVVRRQGPGEAFGEIALLHESPRTATVRAVGGVEVLRLDGDAFVGAITGHGEAREAAESVAVARLSHARPDFLAR
jgi:MFS family permease